MSKSVYLVLALFGFTACQNSGADTELPSSQTSAERQEPSPEKISSPPPRDTLWHWEVPSSYADNLIYLSDSANSWKLIPINKSDFERYEKLYKSQNLFKAEAALYEEYNNFWIPTQKHFVHYDSRVQNPNWHSKDWYYYYFGYAQNLKLHFAARSRIVAQSLILDSISGKQFVLNGNYDGAWTQLIPAPGKDQFMLLGEDTYSGQGFSLVQAQMIRAGDSLQFRKAGQFQTNQFYPLELVWINRRDWALKCLEYQADMYPDKSDPDTLYFKSIRN
ncbi:hypothetical protein [Croceimicrobium hydrocarbonivorans]|uniref:Uncharacterized protein n=1 Tax=Croceimicrobium hydrocarbonivorans TaxID=2761580 RepID=A0A7H0VBG8_9FLAO|nr:hypothetical protein [Croceimicrobium hydrocarbonivorans]QNR23066.1 hypothetical protein H4K34_11830 [Croceimicrobium hydrocarbonivorans]